MANIKKGARAYYADTDYRRDGTFEAYSKIDGIPTPTTEDAGKILKVDENGEFDLADDAGTVLPVPTAADSGKVVKVGSDGYELGNVPNELPAYSSADEGKFLGVDAQGQLGFFEQPGGDAGGDITWERELVDEWDFTESLISKNYNKSFVIDGADISRTSDGIVFGTNSTEQTVYSSDFHDLPITDWDKIDIELEVDAVASTQSMRALFSVWSSVKNAYSLGLDFDGLANGFKWISNTFVTPPENFTNIRSAARNLCLNLETGTLYTHGILITGNFTFGGLFADAMADTDHNRFYLGTNAGWLGNPNAYKFKKLRIYKHITQGG